jgi:hypothetical protein
MHGRQEGKKYPVSILRAKQERLHPIGVRCLPASNAFRNRSAVRQGRRSQPFRLARCTLRSPARLRSPGAPLCCAGGWRGGARKGFAADDAAAPFQAVAQFTTRGAGAEPDAPAAVAALVCSLFETGVLASAPTGCAQNFATPCASTMMTGHHVRTRAYSCRRLPT